MAKNPTPTNDVGDLSLQKSHGSVIPTNPDRDEFHCLIHEQEKVRGNDGKLHSKAFLASAAILRTTSDTAETNLAPDRTISMTRCRSVPTYCSIGPNEIFNSTAASTTLPHRLLRELVNADEIPRCMSCKELRTSAPPRRLLHRNEIQRIQGFGTSTQDIFREDRESVPFPSACEVLQRIVEPDTKESSFAAPCGVRVSGTNETRNLRRAEYHQAVVNDLCEVVADLFIAESKLLKPSTYGVNNPIATNTFQRDEVLLSVHKFVSALPTRYALGVETPSEVLLHMRLMSVARSDPRRAVVHINNLEDENKWREEGIGGKSTKRMRFLLTISCVDTDGLLVYVTNILGKKGSSVLDADVMLSSDKIVLDRFVVEMTGRLRLDKFASMIEDFIKKKKTGREGGSESLIEESSNSSQTTGTSVSGQLFFDFTPADASEAFTSGENECAVPLTQALAPPISNEWHRRNLVNHAPFHDPQKIDSTNVTARNPDQSNTFKAPKCQVDEIPMIPFDDLKLIETLGPGRVSTIYRAERRRGSQEGEAEALANDVQMVALKVAMVNPETGNTTHINELRREADIASKLKHPNVSEFVGVAADVECFCLAYDFYEGGSLLSLLLDSSRYYDCLPIAVDIATGMAYLHSRNVIHRDLKPANILLSRDNRARVADFGMSVETLGQELTAETGTYRYMAPEIIRHESYSSSADVYSFGICLWQLIAREVPFASMTPLQAAYAVAEGQRPEMPSSAPTRLQEIIRSCWDQSCHRRPSFPDVVTALEDYAKHTILLSNVEVERMLERTVGNVTVPVDCAESIATTETLSYLHHSIDNCDLGSPTVGLEIE